MYYAWSDNVWSALVSNKNSNTFSGLLDGFEFLFGLVHSGGLESERVRERLQGKGTHWNFFTLSKDQSSPMFLLPFNRTGGSTG